MKEEFKRDTYRDFIQRYQETYGWYETETKRTVLVQVCGITDTTCVFMDKNGVEYKALSDRGNHFTFIPVQRGLYNTQQGVVFCRRNPARQYKRGICSANTHVKNIEKHHEIELTFDLLEDMFGEKDNRLLQIFKRGSGGNLAINQLFGVVNNNIMLYDNVIGVFEDNCFLLHDTLFKQEVEDLVVEHSLQIVVSVNPVKA